MISESIGDGLCGYAKGSGAWWAVVTVGRMNIQVYKCASARQWTMGKNELAVEAKGKGILVDELGARVNPSQNGAMLFTNAGREKWQG